MNSLIAKSLIVVFVFWYVVFYIYGIIDCGCYIPPTGEYGIYGAILLVAVYGLTWMADRFWGQGILESMNPDKGKRAFFLMGKIPEPTPLPRDTKPLAVPKVLARALRGMPEAHRSLALELLHILKGAPEVPAASVAGGHQGENVYLHTLRVATYAVRRFGDWIGPEDRNLGRPLPEELQSVALLGVLAHDVGKVLCVQQYAPRLDDAEALKRAYRFHDRAGGRVLSRTDGFWALPGAEREILMAVTVHGHHLGAIPDHLGDDALLVAWFVHEMDVATSSDAAAAEVRRLRHPPRSQLRDWLLEWPLRDGVLNNPREDLVFRSGDLLIFNERRIRTLLAAEVYLDPSLSGLQNGNGASPLVTELLHALADEGALYTTHAGASYNPRNALFVVQAHNKHGRLLLDWPMAFAVVIARTGLDEEALKAPFHAPKIVRAVWEQNRNKAPLNVAAPDTDTPDVPKAGKDPETAPPIETPPLEQQPVVDLPADDGAGDGLFDDSELRALMELSEANVQRIQRKQESPARPARPPKDAARKASPQVLRQPVIEQEEAKPVESGDPDRGRVVRAMIEAAGGREHLTGVIPWERVRELAVAGGVEQLARAKVKSMPMIARQRREAFEGAEVLPEGLRLLPEQT